MDKFIEQDAEIKQLRSTVAQQERKLSEFSHYMLTVVPLLIETPRSLMSGSSSQQQQPPNFSPQCAFTHSVPLCLSGCFLSLEYQPPLFHLLFLHACSVMSDSLHT